MNIHTSGLTFMISGRSLIRPSVHKVRHCEHFYEVKPAISIAYLADNEIAEPVLNEVKNLAPSLLRLRLATAPLLAMTRLLIVYEQTN